MGPFEELNDDQKFRLSNKDIAIQEHFWDKKKDWDDLGYADFGIPEGPVMLNSRDLIKQFGIKTGGKENDAFWKSYVDSPGFERIKKNQRNWTKNQNWSKDQVKLIARNNKAFYNDLKYNIKNLDADFLYADRPSQGSFAETVKKGYEEDWRKSYYVIGTQDSYNDENKIFFPAIGTESHEYYHLVDPHIVNGNLETTQNKILDLNQNTQLSENVFSNEHDARNVEKAADIAELKKLLYLEGIYDVRGAQDATPEHIQKLRDVYPNLRPLLQMDNEQAAFMINHIAQNDNKNNNTFYNDYYTT